MWKKIAALIVLVATTSLLIIPKETEARGGRGGGGGGRGGGGARGGAGRAGGGARSAGAYRGGNVMNRTPTMSRATSRPAASQVRQGSQVRQPAASQARRQIPTTRPSVSQGRVQQASPGVSQGRAQQARQTVQQRPSAANRADLRNQVNRHVQTRQTPNIDRQALGQRSQTFANNRGNQLAQNRQLSDRASQRLQQARPESRNWFDRDFFDRHDIGLDYVGTGANWWRPAAWASLASWGAWNWGTPYYYDDSGYAYPVTDTSTYAYPYSTTTTITQPMQTQPVQTQIIQQQPMQSPQTSVATAEEWMPLGVFAIGNNATIAAQSNRFMQLAISKNGEIAGVLYNVETDAAQDLTGMVDTASQKAYWTLSNRTDSPIASTGIYNLTENQTPVNVHFADGSDQTWTLIRLEQGQ